MYVNTLNVVTVNLNNYNNLIKYIKLMEQF